MFDPTVLGVAVVAGVFVLAAAFWATHIDGYGRGYDRGWRDAEQVCKERADEAAHFLSRLDARGR